MVKISRVKQRTWVLSSHLALCTRAFTLTLPVEDTSDDQDTHDNDRERAYIDVPAKELTCAHKNDSKPYENADDRTTTGKPEAFSSSIRLPTLSALWPNSFGRISSSSSHPLFSARPGKGKLARIMSTIYMEDYVSTYLGLLYRVDPSLVKSITTIKKIR